MSFDSRLFRPRRSNSSSASSALVSVGVSSDGRMTPSWGARSWQVPSPFKRAGGRRQADCARATAAATAASMRSSVSVASTSSNSSRTARLRSSAPMPAHGRGRLVEVEQRGRADQAVRIVAQRAISASWSTSSRTTSATSRHGRLLPRHGREDRHGRVEHRVQVQFEQHRRLRQLVGLAPARVQFADMADARGRRPRRGRSARGASPGARRPRTPAGAAPAAPRHRPWRRRSRRPAPCGPTAGCRPGRSPGRPRASAGATPATVCIAVGHAGVALEDAADLEHPHAAGLARQVGAQHLHQAADQAGAHHRQRRGDRVEHLDRIGVAGQLVLPALLDEAEVDRLLVVQRRPARGAPRGRCGAPRDARAPSPAPAAASPAAGRSR